MVQSAFVTWINKYFKGIVTRVTETLNDTKNPLTYLHKRMLKKEFSVTGKWESVNGVNTLVMADLVAMDSSLPLKMRDSIGKVSGDIPKMGMEMKLNERQLSDLDVLVAQNANGDQEGQIVAKLFNDVPKVIGGINERNEAIFLEGLSTGITSVPDDKNVGAAIRVDYGYKTANKFGVMTAIWSTSATATPFNDIQRVIDKANADGNSITKIMMDRTAYNNMIKTTDMKQMVGWNLNFGGDFTKIPTPTSTQANAALKERFGVDIEIVDRSVKYEKNGVQTAYKPWADGAVVFLTSDQVGSLVWAKLAEMNHPVEKVNYQTSDDYILVSKYRENKPSLTEVTNSQARVVPVIGNVDAIYTLDTKTVQA